ncbi:16S rRNA (guanine(966)-N(2))-methyltransferase RsmD [Aquibacillus halophilus]|uniref:16S rRNA (Guanine(966)-N(2))-methyltransferase RsmD n=1 Tax=Aquibacillus halophilus TaxID=930132 RepID=A0A6A8DC83_9BACI|nr:16S rRNA (guanine(966)-N(2))-methyltransferase RsmD [Aquibacillus halophilus]MRH42146.1 16S rRNA (guanine(966)-N(2))-methyltransferase RsmD [Aquibacillus halophilus]
MRVISGIHKGRQIKAVPNQLTRPTTDKAKEALFQIIGPFFEGGQCLDLFAGSGSLGIEALSRGMDHAIFVDKHPKAIHTIHDNLKTLKLEEHAEVFRNDAFRAIKAAAKRELVFDLIFLDPPYAKISYEDLLDEISKFNLLASEGLIICEHDKRKTLPENYSGFVKLKSELYGSATAITLFEKGDNTHE